MKSSTGSSRPSTFQTDGLLQALMTLYQHWIGEDDDTSFYIGDESVQKGYTYGLVNLAAFLSQLMSENIHLDSCNNSTTALNMTTGDYALRNACGLIHPTQSIACSEDTACFNDSNDTCACVLGKLNNELGMQRANETDGWSLFPTVDFCDKSGDICSAEEFPELKWLIALQSWAQGVQSYNLDGWDYKTELHRFVDDGYDDIAFLYAVTGIVDQGCHSPPCSDQATEKIEDFRETAKIFDHVLDLYGKLLPTVFVKRDDEYNQFTSPAVQAGMTCTFGASLGVLILLWR